MEATEEMLALAIHQIKDKEKEEAAAAGHNSFCLRMCPLFSEILLKPDDTYM